MGAELNAKRNASVDTLADVQVELTVMIFDRLLPTVFLSGFGMVAMTGMLAVHYGSQTLWTLDAIMLALWIGRVALVLRFNAVSSSPMDVSAARRWELVYGYYTVLYTGAISVSCLLSAHAPDPVHFMFAILGIFVISNGISARLGMRPSILLLQGFPMIGSLIWVVLHSPWSLIRWSVLLLVGFAYSFWEGNAAKFQITVQQLRSRALQRNLAEQDALTGLGNRRYFETRLNKLCGGTGCFAVFFLDLDGFKRVNDTHGHATGDTLLQHVAQRLKGAVRGTDVVARFGGDEFAILQSHDCTEASARALADRLLHIVAAPYTIDGTEVGVGTSIGIELSHAPHQEARLLLGRADAALYQVKQSGKGSLRFAGAPLGDPAACLA